MKEIFKGSQLANMKKSIFMPCHRHEIYRVEAVGLQKIPIILKNYDICEYVKFGANSLKIDIFKITP